VSGDSVSKTSRKVGAAEVMESFRAPGNPLRRRRRRQDDWEHDLNEAKKGRRGQKRSRTGPENDDLDFGAQDENASTGDNIFISSRREVIILDP
jgi:hypothetical protein